MLKLVIPLFLLSVNAFATSSITYKCVMAFENVNSVPPVCKNHFVGEYAVEVPMDGSYASIPLFSDMLSPAAMNVTRCGKEPWMGMSTRIMFKTLQNGRVEMEVWLRAISHFESKKDHKHSYTYAKSATRVPLTSESVYGQVAIDKNSGFVKLSVECVR